MPISTESSSLIQNHSPLDAFPQLCSDQRTIPRVLAALLGKKTTKNQAPLGQKTSGLQTPVGGKAQTGTPRQDVTGEAAALACDSTCCEHQ